MRFKKFFAGMTAAAITAGMVAMLPASAKDMPNGEALLKADGTPVIAKAAFASGDWAGQDWSSSIEVVRGENKLRIAPKDEEGKGKEIRTSGAAVFCIDLEDIYDQYPNMQIDVTKVTLYSKQYDENGNLITKETTDKETGETIIEPKLKSSTLKAPNLEKPEKDAATTLDYSKIVTGDPEGKNNWRVELYNEYGSTKSDENNPFKGIDAMEYDYIDVTFNVMDDVKAEKDVFSDYTIPDIHVNHENSNHEVYLMGSNSPTDHPALFNSAWDSSTITGMTVFLKVNEEQLAKAGFMVGAVGTNNSSTGWATASVFSSNGYVKDENGNYVDSNNDGYVDTNTDPANPQAATPIKVSDGVYAFTVVNENCFFDQFDRWAHIWMQNWTNDEDGNPLVDVDIDHIVLNPAPENVYLNEKLKMDGTTEQPTYTAPDWYDFNEMKVPDEPDKPDDPNPTDSEDILYGDVTGDGKINVTDITKVAAHVKNLKPLTTDAQFKAADVNFDGKINVTDSVKIAAHVKGIKQLTGKPADEPQDPDNDPTSAEVENLPYDAFLMFTNTSWGWGNWNGHSTSAADKGAYGVDAILNGDGEYTVSITPESLETPDPAVEADAELGIHDAGIYRDEATGEIIPSEGATVFCVDITGICDGTMTWDGEATKKGTQKKFTDADPTKDVMGKGRYTGQELTVKVTSIKADGVEIKFDESKFKYGNIEDDNNRYRIEIYNQYGTTKDDPGIDFANLKFSKELSVTFTIEGLTKG